jgi:hypothetical protein
MRFVLLLAPLGLAGCQAVSPSVGSVPSDLVEAVGLFARDGVVADIYADRCAEQGVALADPNGEDLVGKFAVEMLMQGYLPDQVEAALSRKNPAQIAADARTYITEQGLALDGDASALCAGARSEASRNSGPGRFLKTN